MADVLETAAREIGYREGAGKRNKYGAWYGMDGVAWCMEFVQWVYAHAGVPLPFRTASCGALLRWYRANRPECVTDEPVPGCVVIFDFPGGADTDHTGIFVEKDALRITTIDGNTSNESEGNGGWVQRRTRGLAYANPTYIVPAELKTESGERMERCNTREEIERECPWAAPTVEKLLARGILRGGGAGLDLSRDMLRLLVMGDRAGLWDK